MRYQFDGVLTQEGKEGLLGEAQAAFVAGAPLFASDVTLWTSYLYEYERVPGTTPGRPWEFRRTTSVTESLVGGTGGTAAGQSLPPQNAVVVTLRSPFPGPSRRGRLYTPPPPEASVDGAGVIADATSRADWIRTIAEAFEGFPAVASDRDHIVHSLATGVATEVTQYTCGGRVDTQRRRRSRD